MRTAIDLTDIDISTVLWGLGVDNGFTLYTNGTLVDSDNQGGGTFRWEYNGGFGGALEPGTNVIAVALEDHGGATGFDMQVTAALPPTLTIDDASVTEGGDLDFSVSLSYAVFEDAVITYSTADGSATTADNDYLAQINQTLTIPAGQTTGTITVVTTQDNDFEPDETLDLNLTAVLVNDNTVASGPIFWTNWMTGTGSTTADPSAAPFVGSGIITTGTLTVTVTYTNPQGIHFFQPGPGVVNSGTDYYQNRSDFDGSPSADTLIGRNPATSPFTSTVVTNIPTNTDLIALIFAGSQTLTFSEVIANPVFSYVSLNGNGYGFDHDFEILSFGDSSDGNDCGYFRCGTSFKNVVDLGGGNFEYQLLGGSSTNTTFAVAEPHGTIRFLGAFDTLTWRSLSDEEWNGFTIGVQGTSSEVGVDVTIADGTGVGTILNDDTANVAPTGITLSPSSVDENSANETEVGIIEVTDPDTGDTHTLELTDTANGRFALSDGKIVVADGSQLDFETDTSHGITVEATDQGGTGLSLSVNFTVDINDLNEEPTSITLSPNSVDENSAPNTVVGTITVTDPDVGDTDHTLALTDDAGGRFTLSGNQIVVTDGSLLDFETNTSHGITVKATDQGGTGLTLSVILTVDVINVVEPRDLKVGAIDGLTQYSGESKKIQKAIREINKSLEKGWVNDSQLDPKHGQKVFDREKHAVKELMHVLKDETKGKNKVSPGAETAATTAIADLVLADQMLAQVALAEAQDAVVVDPTRRQEKVDKEIAKADKELAKGDSEGNKNKPKSDKAIDHYKKSWKHSQKAIKFAAKVPKPEKGNGDKSDPLHLSSLSSGDAIASLIEYIEEQGPSLPLGPSLITDLNAVNSALSDPGDQPEIDLLNAFVERVDEAKDDHLIRPGQARILSRSANVIVGIIEGN